MKKTILLTVGIIVLILIVSLDVFSAPSFQVEVVGHGKKSIIFIPGLSCPGDVWKETVNHYKDKYECHVISLPGFAGRPSIESTAYLAQMRDEIAQYIRDQKLKKPIIMGHSLGGFLALWISISYPDLVYANLIIDSLPFLGAAQNPNATVETVTPTAENMRKMMQSASPTQVKEAQKYFLPGMVNNVEKRALISDWGVASHSPTVAQAMYEMQTTDLRKELSKIKAPTLVLGAWIGYKDYGVTKEMVQKNYDTQYIELHSKTILLSDSGKHFLMYDDADWFLRSCDEFLKLEKL